MCGVALTEGFVFPFSGMTCNATFGLPSKCNEARHLNHFKLHLMSPILPSGTKQQGKQVSKEGDEGVQSLPLSSPKLKMKTSHQKFSNVYRYHTRSQSIPALENGGEEYLFWVVFLYELSSSCSPLFFLLICRTCVVHYMGLPLWAMVEGRPGRGRVWFASAEIYLLHQMIV